MTPHAVPDIAVPIVIALIAFRAWRGQASRRLRLEWLWVMPAIMVLAAVPLLMQSRLEGADWAWLALAAAIGGTVGWYRGKAMRITVDPETHALNQQASPSAIIFLAALVAVRFGLRSAMEGQAAEWHLNPLFITDIFLLFVLGMLSVQRLEMAVRARRMLADIRRPPVA